MYKNNKNKQMKYANKVVYQYRKRINKRIKRKERYPLPNKFIICLLYLIIYYDIFIRPILGLFFPFIP